MYKDFNNNNVIQGLKLKPYNQLNDVEKSYFEMFFGEIDTTHVYCVYCPSIPNSVCGYVRLAPNKITNSEQFRDMCISTDAHYGECSIDTIESCLGFQIKDWCLESQFENNDLLLNTLTESIFGQLWEQNKTKMFVWGYSNGNLRFKCIDLSDDQQPEYASNIKDIFKV